MKLAEIYNHIRLTSGLVRRRSGATSALSKRAGTEDGVSREVAKESQRVTERNAPLIFSSAVFVMPV